MRVLFFGSGEFGLPTLRALAGEGNPADAGGEPIGKAMGASAGDTAGEFLAGTTVVGVVTQPDRRAGRKRQWTATPIAAWAAARGLVVWKTADVNEPGFIEQVRALKVDASVVIAFGQKLSPPLVEAMAVGNPDQGANGGRVSGLAVNLHASLLPKYRGAAPINRAMMNGETVTGLSVIGLAQRMDAGEVYATARTSIDPRETAGELHDRLADMGPEVMARVLGDLARGTLAPQPQDEQAATRAAKLSKADGTVDFNQPADAVRARIHGLTPWPGCRVRWSASPDQSDPQHHPLLTLHRVRVHPELTTSSAQPGTILPDLHVATAKGAIELLELQAPGTRVMPAPDFVRGHHLVPGDRLAMNPA